MLQSCPTLFDPMDCCLRGSSVYEDSPGENTRMDCHAFLQGIFPTQGLNPCLLHCRWIFHHWGGFIGGPIFSWAPKSLQMVTAAMKLKDVFSLEESYDKPGEHIKKQRCSFTYKGPYHQSYGFSSSHIWMWELTIKKVERQRIDAFELWCWRRLLRVPWTLRRSNQSIVKEINPDIHWKDWCWSWSSNTVATWCDALNN